ncbi:MAG: hypothetical protein KOO60_03725 [Gemmatimonadales bacterium]|nr:hypothetical protein [Gemmatimonadales bacterium]
MTLTIPETKEILDLVELLIGEKPVFRQGEGWDLTKPEPGTYITFLQGRDNQVEGAILTDLAAALYIGGKLILLPEATLMDQMKAGEAEEPIVEAVTEVINNMRTLFNNIDLNPHVAPTATFLYQVPAEDDFVAWIINPRKRVDYVGKTTFGQATLTLIAP